jgi:protein subunit release factor B
VVKSQATRSRSQNEKIARQLLADKVEQLEKGDQSRTAIKVDRARKKKASKMKKSRRKYRELEKGGEELQEQEGFDDADGEQGSQGLARDTPPNVAPDGSMEQKQDK